VLPGKSEHAVVTGMRALAAFRAAGLYRIVGSGDMIGSLSPNQLGGPRCSSRARPKKRQGLRPWVTRWCMESSPFANKWGEFHTCFLQAMLSATPVAFGNRRPVAAHRYLEPRTRTCNRVVRSRGSAGMGTVCRNQCGSRRRVRPRAVYECCRSHTGRCARLWCGAAFV
jgi:hypothetical protein